MAAKKVERSYGLSAAEARELAEEFKASKRFPNPYRAGAYRFTVEALVALGVNKPHPLDKVREEFRKAAGDEWYQSWARKEKRDDETGKDADERFVQNLRVLQRTKDYGRKLLEVGRKVMKTKGAVIDLTRADKGELLIALNVNRGTPKKAGRASPSRVEPKGKSAPAKRKSSAKGRPAKAASKKPQD